MVELGQLAPQAVWRIFDQIRQIPRRSGHEESIRLWLLNWAAQHNFEALTDAVGNVCIHVPATPGLADLTPVCLQNHMDMVCVKNDDRDFDFDQDPIEVYLDGDWLSAVGTTLGADNGVGLAMAMALALEPDLPHPDLEILVTVEEETTFKGAFNLDPQALRMRAKTLLNLDGEELGQIYISSAGMLAIEATLTLDRDESAPDWRYYQVHLSGLPGGHSGAEIHEERGNAIITLIAMFAELGEQVRLVKFDGGQAKNAIPGSAKAVVACANPELARLLSQTEAYQEALTDHLSLLLECSPITNKSLAPLRINSQHSLFEAVLRVPNGVICMHEQIPNLVATSSNIGVAHVGPKLAKLEYAIRSAYNNDQLVVGQAITALLEAHDWTHTQPKIVPAWEGDAESPLVTQAMAAFKLVAPAVTASPAAIHAGLEVGPIANKLGERLPAIAFGPDIINPHSPDEAVNLKSVAIFYEVLKELIRSLPA